MEAQLNGCVNQKAAIGEEDEEEADCISVDLPSESIKKYVTRRNHFLNTSVNSSSASSGDLLVSSPGSVTGSTSDYCSGEEERSSSVRTHPHQISSSSSLLAWELKKRATTSATHDELVRALLPAMNGVETQPSVPRIYKLVLTGGPCGGKTTGQVRLASFFEHIGWKVFTVPECATVLLSGGVRFEELNPLQTHQFQKDLLLTLMQIEKVFFNQAELVKGQNVLIICDRGAMDPSAYLPAEAWEKVLKECDLSTFDLRENRYDQIVHMVTAADGAESFYSQKNNSARFEGLNQALEQDRRTRNAWLGHPYVDIIDNGDCESFNAKILQLIQVVCDRIGLPHQDRLSKNSKKRKWLVRSFDEARFPKYEEFEVVHIYLLVDDPDVQVRIRKRCQNRRSTYTLTTRRQVHPSGEWVETRMQLPQREYTRYITAMRDRQRYALHKRRRCFTYGAEYFHLDIYVSPLPPACQGHRLMILETYTTVPQGESAPELPPFLDIEREITSEAAFSMYNLSKFNGAEPISTPSLTNRRSQQIDNKAGAEGSNETPHSNGNRH